MTEYPFNLGGNVCLHYLRIPNLETCQDMPSRLTLPMTNVTDQIYRQLPWFWSEFRVISLTKVYIQSIMMTRVLYSYIPDTEEADLVKEQYPLKKASRKSNLAASGQFYV